VIQLRLDAELAQKVVKKASQYGGMSVVIRALLRRWVEDDILSAEDIVREVGSARRGRRPKDSK
jgi:hypothetical protein